MASTKPEPQDGETDGAIGLDPSGELNVVEEGSPRKQPRIIPDNPSWEDFMPPEVKAAKADADFAEEYELHAGMLGGEEDDGDKAA